jgi:DNA primase
MFLALLSSEEINNIRAKADIVNIIGSYIPLTQRGKNYLCVCPFHDDHSPSMSVSSEKQIYKCFACGATGNVFTFVQDYENVSFMEAVSIVADKCGIELSFDPTKAVVADAFVEEHKIMDLSQKFFVNNLKTSFGKEATKYLNERGISEDIIKEFGIGLSLDTNDSLYQLLSKKGYSTSQLDAIGLISNSNGDIYDMFTRRITFPLWDKDGKIVGFSARIYRGEKNVSKYMNSRETKIFRKGETLYNYHNAKDAAKREKEIIVVEGFMDAIRISSIGLKNVVALCGTAMTKEQISLLKKLRCKVILCLDNDNAGLLATVNNGEELVKENVETYVIRLTGEKDPDEYIIANGKDAFIENVKRPLTYFDFKMDYFKQNKDLNNVEDLSQYVNEVLKTISSTDDSILREVTLNKLSKDYNLSIDVLKNRLEKYEPVTLKEKKEETKLVREKKDSYKLGAERILYFMMNDGDYIEEYQTKLGFFSEQLYREIANEIVYYYETNGEITVADFITYVSDKDSIRGKVMEIVNESVNDELNMETMDEYIAAVLKVANKNEIKRLKDLMKKELDQDKKMKLAMQIAELKKEDV